MVQSSTSFLRNLSEYYVQILEVMASFLLLFILFSVILRWLNRRKGVLTDWPVLRMLPDALANIHLLHDYVTCLLKVSKRTFLLKGPWFTGMEMVVTCDPANVRHILSLNFSNYNKGKQFNEVFDFYGDGIFIADSESWKFQRKMAHAAMTGGGFRTLVAETGKEKTEKKLLPFLSRMERGEEAFDLQAVLLRFNFDVTSVLVFGVDPGCLSLDLPGIPFAEAVDRVHEVAVRRHLVPMFWWKTMRFLRMGEEKRMAMALQVIDDYLAGVIAGRREEKGLLDSSNAHRRDLLASYIGNDSLGDEFLRDALFSFLTAGRDTVSNTLLWFFWLLANHPNVEAKILQEMRDSEPTMSQDGPAANLIYLHAALCETLRLFPPIPLNHKAAVQADVLPSGHKVRGGGVVIISAYALGRMEEIWGEDCTEFKPERWITETGKLRHEPSFKFLAFNSGPRTCLGKDMAFTLVRSIAAAVIKNFGVFPVHGQRVEPKLSIMLGMKNGLMVKLRKRPA